MAVPAFRLRRRSAIGALLAALLPALPFAPAPTPVRILFIGNSYTYFNNLPAMVERLAASGSPSTPVTTRLLARGGATLKDHFENPAVVAAIREGTWDYVVLQEQSTLGGTGVVDGRVQIRDPAFFHDNVRTLAAEIGKTKARTVLLQTWARESAPAADAAALRSAYGSIGKEIGAIVVPAGAAWSEVRQADSSARLFIADGSHPSATGSYLAAATFVAVVLGVNPVGAPAVLRGRVIDIAERVGADSLATMVALDPKTAALLQRVAWEVARGR